MDSNGKILPFDGAGRKQTKARMELQEGIGSNTEDQGRKRPEFDDTLCPERGISKLFGSTYRILTNIRVVFHYMDKDMTRKI